MKETLDLIAPFTADSEGFSASVYKCPAGFDTIGYGRNIEANPLSASEKALLENGKVSKEVALIWLKEELEKCYKQLDSALPYFKSLDTARKGALCDMCYNLGFKGLMSFKNTLKFVEAKEWQKVCANLAQSKWYKQVGRRSKRISAIFETGVIA